MRFVAYCCRLQGVTYSQRLVSKVYPTMCRRNAEFGQYTPFIKLHGDHLDDGPLTLNQLKTTIVAPPSNASKWQMGFNSAFKGLKLRCLVISTRVHHILYYLSSYALVLSWGIPILCVTQRCIVRKSKTQHFLSVIMLFIERHVSAYSEAIIKFNNCQLYETNDSGRQARRDIGLRVTSP